MSTVVVIAKSPVAGQVKTRLCPPLTIHGAARLAAAALDDTLDAVRGAAATRRVLALAGALSSSPPGFEVRPQRGDCFADRLVAAFADAGPGPVLLIGMDTPQLGSRLIEAALTALLATDAVLGRAIDGGWWALGLQNGSHAEVLHGVSMSTPDTAAATYTALRALGLRISELPRLRDVDTFPDAVAVARLAPATRFASALELVLADGAVPA
ncbi:MAG: DUF2064 domain-containing protein [Actinomycetota bacterium]|nr:DUF2064 domain-containing protein [Actinomycetota bacterium]